MQTPDDTNGGKLPHAEPMPRVREGIDAEDEERLKVDPSDEDAKLDIGLDETFPTSDPPANTQPGGGEPAPSTGFDEDEERRRSSAGSD